MFHVRGDYTDARSKVNRAVDVDSGKLIAVKIVKIRQNQNKEAFFKLLKREVEAIGRIEHVSGLSPGQQAHDYIAYRDLCASRCIQS